MFTRFLSYVSRNEYSIFLMRIAEQYFSNKWNIDDFPLYSLCFQYFSDLFEKSLIFAEFFLFLRRFGAFLQINRYFPLLSPELFVIRRILSNFPQNLTKPTKSLLICSRKPVLNRTDVLPLLECYFTSYSQAAPNQRT